MKNTEIKNRLEELRTELRNECISYGELIELQSLVEHIDKNDVELLEAAVPIPITVKMDAVKVIRRETEEE